MAGPFAGMAYPTDRLADVGAPGAKLLGSYEHEIADIFAEAILGDVDVFVDVGSAEGYYAVGMAFANPGLTTYAYDLSRSARGLCATIADLNGVGDRVHIGRRCDAAALARLPLDNALLLCDIEGAEGAFFDTRIAELLRRTRVVVEVHEGAMAGLGDQVADAFRNSHVTRVIHQREPPPHDERLADWSPSDLAVATTEARRASDHWLDFVPRG